MKEEKKKKEEMGEMEKRKEERREKERDDKKNDKEVKEETEDGEEKKGLGEKEEEEEKSKQEDMVVEERMGDLFSASPSISLAHCISKDINMSAGIALAFKKEFGRVEKLRQQQAKVGEIAILEEGDRFIYNLVTKEKYYGKPTIASLRKSLVMMRSHMEEKGVKEVAMPRIGCGLDRIDWGKVKIMLEEVFSGSDLKVIVYTLEKKKKMEKLTHPGSPGNPFKCKQGLKCL